MQDLYSLTIAQVLKVPRHSMSILLDSIEACGACNRQAGNYPGRQAYNDADHHVYGVRQKKREYVIHS